MTVHKSKSEDIARQLLERMVAARLAPGSSFATEAELLQEFDVSRPTLRESLKILESQGALALRPGPGGGILVSRPSVDMLAHTLSVFLRLHEVPFLTVLKSREVIEPALAGEAAVNATEEDLAEMEASVVRMGHLQGPRNQEAFLAENRNFHGLIARASGNRVLETFWSAISLLASGEHHGLRYSVGNQDHIVAAHERILAACRARDGAAAAQAMRSHVGELENLVRMRYRKLLDSPPQVLARSRKSAA
jgi:DNA-binding FadR family transcriptional regulator